MYVRSLIVFALCTAFVVGFVVVIDYATSGVGRGGETLSTIQPSCSATAAACMTFSLTSPSLRSVNFTDELGTVNYANLVLGVNASGDSPLTSVRLFVGNTSAGIVQGPFEPGLNRVLNLTLPATISVTPGATYTVTVEGFYANGSTVWKSVEVIAR